MEGLGHQLIHPTNAGRRAALTPVAIVVAMLAAILALPAGAGAADSNVSAAAAQYPVAAVQGVQGGSAPSSDAAIPLGEETAPTDPVPTDSTQVVEAAAAESAASPRARGEVRLPFTGHLVLPLLIGGAMLLVAGLTLRRRVSGQPA